MLKKIFIFAIGFFSIIPDVYTLRLEHFPPFEVKVATNLASACMMQFLEEKGSISKIKWGSDISAQTLEGVAHNYCAAAVVDCTNSTVNYLLWDMVPRTITKTGSCVQKNIFAVFVSNCKVSSIGKTTRALYRQYFESFSGEAINCVTDIINSVRAWDSEQSMLAALEPMEVREQLFNNIAIENDIRLVVYSLRNNCQHCHFMLGGFLKEMIEAQKLRAIDFFYSFSVGTNAPPPLPKVLKKTHICLVPPLFCNIPLGNNITLKSIVVADCWRVAQKYESNLLPLLQEYQGGLRVHILRLAEEIQDSDWRILELPVDFLNTAIAHKTALIQIIKELESHIK